MSSSRAAPSDAARFEERPAGVFDVIGRRRWFYAFSLLITIPGFLFILLTPLTGDAIGIKFSIDYTGGTEWEIRFADPNVTSDQILAVLTGQGLPDSTVTPSTGGFFTIRTKPIGLPAPIPTPTPVPTARPTASPSGSAGASPSGSPGASASTGASASGSS